MSERINVNGVFREPPEVASLVNGVWRKHKKIFININGVFRNTFNKKERPLVVKHFIIEYALNKFRKHPDFPTLRYNRKIPYKFQINKYNYLSNLDLNEKSLLFEYNNSKYEEEGIIMFEGHIYLVTLADEKIDIGQIPIDYRLHDINLTISYEVVDENYGYEVFGWNSIFSANQFIHSKGKPDVINQYHSRVNDMIIAPEWKRNEDYNPTLDIGIARDMTHPNKNMIGSRGVMTHTIYDIKVNGESKPFQIEIIE